MWDIPVEEAAAGASAGMTPVSGAGLSFTSGALPMSFIIALTSRCDRPMTLAKLRM